MDAKERAALIATSTAMIQTDHSKGEGPFLLACILAQEKRLRAFEGGATVDGTQSTADAAKAEAEAAAKAEAEAKAIAEREAAEKAAAEAKAAATLSTSPLG